MRILLITHADLAFSPSKAQSSLVKGIQQATQAKIALWEELETPSIAAACASVEAEQSDFEACLLMVRFRRLMASTGIEWDGFSGLKVWYEEDAVTNYSPSHPRWNGKYTELWRREAFDLMIATGKRTTELLQADGVSARWIPKGYTADAFYDLGLDRSGICTFGTLWPSRRKLLHHLDRRGIDIADVSGPFETLNARLNAHTGALVCNMLGRPPFARVGRAINRVFPSFVTTWPASEPMIKTFEVAGAGCAPIVDHLDELTDLGFVDGETCRTYRTFDEAGDLLSEVSSDELLELGQAAAALAQSRHTWGHRAAELVHILENH